MTDTRPKRIIELFAAGYEPAAISRRFALPIHYVYYVILCDKLSRADKDAQKERKERK